MWHMPTLDTVLYLLFVFILVSYDFEKLSINCYIICKSLIILTKYFKITIKTLFDVLNIIIQVFLELHVTFYNLN